MKKYNLAVFIIIALLFSGTAGAMIIPSSDQAKEHSKAPEKSPVISETPSGEWDLERVDFVHYARPIQPVKPSAKTETCYKLMGVSWSATSSYVVNPTNPFGLSEEFISNNIHTAAENWDAQTSAEIFSDSYFIDYSAVYGSLDSKNAIVFGNYGDSNVIGVTSIWYSRKSKQIIEFDMILNTQFLWGDATINSSVMDLQNIVSHELGHAIGLADVYTTSCGEVTMYGYASEGEINKRTLETPDINGLRTIYGF